jgi:uncharacterized protein Usg
MDKETKRTLSSTAVLILALIAIVTYGLIGVQACHKMPVHPGALDTFDSNTYDALLIAQAVLDQAKIEYKLGNFPTVSLPFINKAGDSYNVARDAWLTYRAIKLAGATGNELQDAMSRVTALLGQLDRDIADVRKLLEKRGK